MRDDSKRDSKEKFSELFREMEGVLGRPGLQVDLDTVGDLIDRIHLAKGDEREKLRRKDQALVNTIARLERVIGQAGWMPQGTAFAFKGVIAALMQVEAILWELKGEKGPIPKPQLPSPGGGGPQA